MRRSVLFGLAGFLLAGAALAQTPSGDSNASLDAKLDAAINPHELDGWMKLLAAEPNQVGSPTTRPTPTGSCSSSRASAGTPISKPTRCSIPRRSAKALEMPDLTASPGRRPCRSRPSPATLSSTAKEYALPAYLAYQGDGDVTAPLVYVNYGNVDDYKRLEQLGISVKGKIVIARYGEGWRGLKPKLAQDHGAIGA